MEVSGRTATSADSKTGPVFRDTVLFLFCSCFYLSCSCFFFVFVYRFTSATLKNLELFCVTNCCCCVHSVQRKGTRRASSLEVETLLSPALFCSISKNLKGGNDTEHLFSYFIECGELTKKHCSLHLIVSLQWKCFICS